MYLLRRAVEGRFIKRESRIYQSIRRIIPLAVSRNYSMKLEVWIYNRAIVGVTDYSKRRVCISSASYLEPRQGSGVRSSPYVKRSSVDSDTAEQTTYKVRLV